MLSQYGIWIPAAILSRNDPWKILFPQRDTFFELYEFGEQIVDYLLFRFQTFDAAEVTKEI